MATGREKDAKLKTEQRITTALIFSVPPFARYKIKIGDRVLEYREKYKWV